MIARLTTLLACAALTMGSAMADERTMSFNEQITVVPAPGPVVVDGKTDDWDLSAGVWSYNDPTIVERFSVWTHLMWDEQGVYFLARYHDPTPMKNAAAGKDFALSWRADAYQARVIFDDRTDDEHIQHVNMYYSSPDDRPYMIVHHGGFKAKPPYDGTGPQRPDQEKRWGPTMESAGGRIAVAPWDDGTGYNLEAFWPWSYCRTSGKALKPGDQFVFGIEAMWGSSDGTQLAHRLADGIKDETVNRIFMFRAREGWGKAVIADAGGLTITDEQKALQKARRKNFENYDTYGSIPISYELPEDRDVTIAIEDTKGKRIRNLFGQYPKEAGTVTDLWDGLDDEGNPVSPGTYVARVLHHEPIKLSFFNSVYSSSTPPWGTDKGKLFWGSNHGHPTSAATKGDVTILYFTGTEGGSGIQRIDENGIILWCDRQEFIDGTIDDDYAYGLSKSSWQQKTLLCRFRLSDGHLTPFDDPEHTPSPTLLGDKNIDLASSLAMAYGKLWACYPGRIMQRIDPKTAAVEEELPIADWQALTDRDGQLYGLTTTGAVHLIDDQGQSSKELFQLRGLKQPYRLGVDHSSQRFVISDQGTNQVIICDRAGKVLQRIGSAYEADDRPAGTFVKTDLIKPVGCAFDAKGRLWIPEGKKSCKRVGLWSADGELLDQFWGQADYGAMEGWPIRKDATRFIAHGIEFKLDPDPDPWHRKTNEEPLIYHPGLAGRRGQVFTYEGQDFAISIPGFNQGRDVYIFRRNKQQTFVPCVVIEKNQRKGKGSAIGKAWIDRNGDGKRSDDEVTEKVDWPTLYWSNGHVRPDLTLMNVEGDVYPCQGLNEHGVPIYDFSSPKKIRPFISTERNRNSGSTPVIDSAGTVSTGLAWRSADGRSGQYPNPYGRHDAPAARRGLIIAAFRANGVVEDVPGVGSITAISGDRGEWFVMSLDGLYISSICQDIKGNTVLDETYIGGESFGGYIWRDEASGKILVQLGGASYRLMELQGLESCVVVEQRLEVTKEQIQAGIKIAQERQQTAVAEPDRLRIAKVREVPKDPPPVMQPLSQPLIQGAVDVKVSEEGSPGTWWRAAMATKGKDLVVAWQVGDATPWQNGSNQYTHAFIGGDCVDLQLDVPGRGPIRVMVAKVEGKNTVIYWQQEAVKGDDGITYAVQNNLTNATKLGQVKRLDTAKAKVATGFNSYTVLLTVPLSELGLDKAQGQEIRGIIGAIYSDPSGTNRALRLYWHDKETGLVNDVPSEARLNTKRWGPIDIDR